MEFVLSCGVRDGKILLPAVRCGLEVVQLGQFLVLVENATGNKMF